jgi:MFS transporter, DHA3 family, macrolide efflux protein
MISAKNSFRKLPLVQALAHRPVFMLWVGEALSAIGDEIYRVALIWLAVELVGSNAGFLGAAQAASVLLIGLIGGKWADHWDPRRTMIGVDLLRAALVMIPVLWTLFAPLNFPALALMALSVSALGAFFEPALQAVIPRLVRGKDILQATNGLMGTTPRLARALGPGIVGLLTGILAPIHFFTLDAVSFLASAFAVSGLFRELPRQRIERPRVGLRQVISQALQLVKQERQVQYLLFAKAVGSGAWNVVLPLGVALLVRNEFSADVKVYGLLMAAYGIGNVAGAVVLSNIRMKEPMWMMGWGFVVLGLGFVGLALAPSLSAKVCFAVMAAVGGPMNDLPHIYILQTRYEAVDLSRVVRLRMAVEFSGIFLALLSAPLLFEILTAKWLIAFAGALTVLVGLLSWTWLEKNRS